MFANQKYASEFPGAHLFEYMYRIKFLWGEEGVRDGFRTIVWTEFTSNRQKTHDQLCVLP